MSEVYEFTITILCEKYYSDDTSWGCYNFATTDNIPHYKEQTISADPFEKNSTNNIVKVSTLSGKMQQLSTGSQYKVKATYSKHNVYGDQYNPVYVCAIVPQTHDTQMLFLKSLISESVAENLLAVYPNIVNDVINKTVETIDYNLVKGVGEKSWERIKEKIINNYLISDIITLLQPLGVTFGMIRKLLDNQPNPALLKEELLNNPYKMVRIKGIGFSKCDQLALKLNPELINSTERLIAYVGFYLRELGEKEGHTWVSEEILNREIINSVPECADKFEWLLNNNDYLHRSNGRVGLRHYYDIERKIFEIISNRIKCDTSSLISDEIIQTAIKQAEKEQGFEYVPEQLKAINAALRRTVSFVTGKAGTGKSTIMRAIVKAYRLAEKNIVSSALSAMAAKRLTEATEFPAATIHRTLGCVGLNKFTFNKDNHMIADVAFLDEGSMVNAAIFLQWLEATNDNCRIVISGDHKQLPPIGFGNIFSDLLETIDKSAVNHLVKPMRQAEMSGILSDANKIRENINPITETLTPRIIHGDLQDMYYMFRTNRESLFNIAVNTFLKSVQNDGLDNVVIVTPRKNNCQNSTMELNREIQERLLPDEKIAIQGLGVKYKLGAKVIQTVNNYDKNVFNGEIGHITYIGEKVKDKTKTQFCVVTYKDIHGKDKHIEYAKNELTDLDLAYAMTTHKIQGNGIPTVIGIIDNTHYQLLDNCMLYTMLTRAKKRCLLLAEPQAFLKCIRTSHNQRNTWMKTKEFKRGVNY